MRARATTLALVMGLFSANAVSADVLQGSEWGPTELKGDAFVPVEDVFIRFESDWRYFGNGGCNTFRGQFTINGDAILLSPAAATMMACPPHIMDQELQFFQTLMTIRQYERSETDLTLSDQAGEVVLRLTQRDAD